MKEERKHNAKLCISIFKKRAAIGAKKKLKLKLNKTYGAETRAGTTPDLAVAGNDRVAEREQRSHTQQKRNHNWKQ